MAATAQAKEVLIEAPPRPQAVGEMLQCLTCGAMTDGTDRAFSELLFADNRFEKHGDWMEREGKWFHLCEHYAVAPQPTKLIDLWK